MTSLETKLRQGLRKHKMLARYTKASEQRKQYILSIYERLNK